MCYPNEVLSAQRPEKGHVYSGRFGLVDMLRSHEQNDVPFVEEVAIISPLDNPRRKSWSVAAGSSITLPKSRLPCKFESMPGEDGVNVEHQRGLLLVSPKMTCRDRSMTVSRWSSIRMQNVL
jgi:hypothetical protein